MRARFLLLLTVITTGLVWPGLEPVSAQSSTGIVISEFRFRGPAGGADEFVELYNAGAAPVNVGGWQVWGSNNNATPATSSRVTIPASTVIGPGCHYLIANVTMVNGVPMGYSGAVAPNATFSVGIVDDGGVALRLPSAGAIVDQVGLGANGAYGENTRLASLGTANLNQGYERRPGSVLGHEDTGNNFNDFQVITPSNPQNLASACLSSNNPLISGALSPVSVEPGQPLTVFATVAPGSVPTSTGLNVVGNLAAVGGSNAEPFSDNGVSPDVTPNDNVFTAAVVVPAGNPIGPFSVTLTVTDAQSRSAQTAVSGSVMQPLVIYLPHEVQGAGSTSPLGVGTAAIVEGVVTARKFNGFFVQTEPDREDMDPNTSEGLFVFTAGPAPAAAQTGHLVRATGVVAEFVPSGDPGSPPLTEFVNVSSVEDLGAAMEMPAPVALTGAEVSAGGAIDQLERFEGMLVSVASLTAVSGTSGNKQEANATSTSDGAFYAVLTGTARPFREAGIEVLFTVLNCAAFPSTCNVPLFDGNPERLRVDSDALEGMAPVDVSTGAVITNVAGPLDFSFRTYTLLPGAPLAPEGGLTLRTVGLPGADQFTVASFNMERFFDTTNDASISDVALSPTAYGNRLSKASLLVRTVLNSPDILGVQEVENLATLQDVAAALNADTVAAGGANPGYVAYLFEGNDPGGIDVGFLVKTGAGRVEVVSVEQVGLDATFVDPSDSSVDTLNDRPPVALRAVVRGPATSLPAPITVINNHLRSLNDVDADSPAGVRVRAKRQAQAEFLANYIQGRQTADSSEAIVSLGDYNAFSFNDGYGDSIGTIRGVPTPADEAVTASPDLVAPDLVELEESPADQRYSYIFGGNAQTLDHVLVTANLVAQFDALVHPRVNADFPEVLRSDATRPERLSDHDPVVAFFSFPADVTPPVLSAVADVTVEGNILGGAMVTYVAPTATDNLDPTVPVSCLPASGSIFPVGSSGVTCTATDVAGNSASRSFSVTVNDTQSPVLSVPANMTVQTTSAAGTAVTFVVTATDLVGGALNASCAPPSGSVFPVATTTVNCQVSDATGNGAAGSFTVTVTLTTTPPQTVAGIMVGFGGVGTKSSEVAFAFEATAKASGRRHAILWLKFNNKKHDSFVAAGVDSVKFSNDPAALPGRNRPALNDTVEFSGTGAWNGKRGYKYVVVASDRGEPGKHRDMLSVTIKAPNGTVVASFQEKLTGGNIQALQPPRK